MKGKPAREVCECIHERGGIAIPPHPFDLFRAGIRAETLETLPIDALEVFNAATTLRRYNEHALHYAQARGLPMTAASDAHHSEALGTALRSSARRISQSPVSWRRSSSATS
jgi:predicted metal-dependent phosphoesterase TrpH